MKMHGIGSGIHQSKHQIPSSAITLNALPSRGAEAKKRRGPRSPKEQEEAMIKQQERGTRERGQLRQERDARIMQDPTAGEKWHLNQLLTTWIMKTQSLSELSDLLSQPPNPERANASNLIAALTQVSWLVKGQRFNRPLPRSQDDPPQSRTSFEEFNVRQKAYALAGSLADRLMARYRKGHSSDSDFDTIKVQGWIQIASALARIGYNDPDRVGAFLPRMLASLPDFSQPRHYAEACWSIAKLRRDPGPLWIKSMLESSRILIHQFNLAELSNVIWSCAKWGYRPPPVYMTLFYRRCTFLLNALDDSNEDLRGGRSGSKSILNPQLTEEEETEEDHQVKSTRGKALIQTLKQVDPAGGNTVGSLSSLVWSLAMLQAQPPPELSRALLIETQVQIPNMSEQGLANIAWGFCKMNIRPPPSWIQDYLKQCRRKLGSFGKGIAFSNIIWALSHWRAEPGEAWLREFVKHSTPTVPSLDEGGIAALLQGLADLEHKPPNSWVSMCLEVFHKQGGRSGGSPETLVAVLWSISRLLMQKKITLVQSAEDSSSALIRVAVEEKGSDKRLLNGEEKISEEASDLDRPPVVSVMASGPGKQWVKFYLPILQDLADGVTLGMHLLDAPRLVDVLVAFADLGVHPGDSFLKAHQRQCDAVIYSFTAYQMKLMSNAQAKLQRII